MADRQPLSLSILTRKREREGCRDSYNARGDPGPEHLSLSLSLPFLKYRARLTMFVLYIGSLFTEPVIFLNEILPGPVREAPSYRDTRDTRRLSRNGVHSKLEPAPQHPQNCRPFTTVGKVTQEWISLVSRTEIPSLEFDEIYISSMKIEYSIISRKSGIFKRKRGV